ncbi:DNA polymerase III subunit delta' [Halopseudomonas sp.]|uniref:DNA polymerase III subunit delta' n=1 Tax=Halopseudomonas sp. TaxID=2901191 RepID=UPI003FA56847
MREPAPWHQGTWQSLTMQQHFAHAYLFSGQAGCGKRRFATAFAAFLLCDAPAAGIACDQCRSCHLRLAGSHPDLLLLEPEEEGKAIRVDAVRQLVDFISQTAQQGGRKVVLLRPAEAMNLNAANALLKSLEEPSAETYLLLVSDQPSRLLPTIRSRCRVQPLELPAPEQAAVWLSEQLPERSAQDCSLLLQMAGGAPLRAMALAQLDALSQREKVVEGIKALLKGQIAPSRLAEQWNPLPIELLLDWFCAWTLDLLKLQQGAVETAASADMDKVLGYMAKKVEIAQLLAWQDWLLEHRRLFASKANLNRVLFLEKALVQWKNLLERR